MMPSLIKQLTLIIPLISLTHTLVSTKASGFRKIQIHSTSNQPSPKPTTRLSDPITLDPETSLHTSSSGLRGTVIDDDESANDIRRLLCYYDNKAAVRPNEARLLVQDLEASLCSHVIYGPMDIEADTYAFKSIRPSVDLEENSGLDSIRHLYDLKLQNPTLKTLVSVGGLGTNHEVFSDMLATAKSRRLFVNHALDFIDKYKLNGIELNWGLSPCEMTGGECDKRNYVNLLFDLKNTFTSKGLILAAQVAAGEPCIKANFDPQIHKHLDMVNLMAYDYHESHDKTGVLAPMYPTNRYNVTLNISETNTNVNWSVHYWLGIGTPRNKINLGVAYSGESFYLDRASENGVYVRTKSDDPAKGVRVLGYNEICPGLSKTPNEWTVVRDQSHMIPYAFKGRQWISYEDRESVTAKAEYVNTHWLGGMMVFTMDNDDFSGRCHGKRYPLTWAIKNELARGEFSSLNSLSLSIPETELMVRSLSSQNASTVPSVVDKSEPPKGSAKKT